MTVVTRHIGRLGNSMWQVANSIGYARKYGYQWGVDPGSGVGEPYSAIHKVFPNLPKAEAYGRKYHEHPHGFCPQHNMDYDLCHFDYHNIPDLGSDVSMTGFFQSWKYFKHCKDEVKEVFKLDHYPEYEGYVSIHVRRGDYVQHAGSFPPITHEYITEAMIYLTEKLKEYRLVWFSDDIQWCKDKYQSVHSGDIYCEEQDERKALSMMASCSHHIIANSSFSWWGAYLGHNPDRIVISPSKETWFGSQSGVKRPVVDLIPDSWIQIHTR